MQLLCEDCEWTEVTSFGETPYYTLVRTCLAHTPIEEIHRREHQRARSDWIRYGDVNALHKMIESVD